MYQMIRPLLFKMDPEFLHDRVLDIAALFRWFPSLSPSLRKLLIEKKPLTLWGEKFDNPLGIAAGFDKNAKCLDLLFALGLGFAEIGSVTSLQGNGNPKPRIFRLPDDDAIINRMGLNNEGAEAVKKHLNKKTPPFPIGVNISKTHSPLIVGEMAIADICHSYRLLKNSGSYTTLNVSCPNTKEGKTFEDVGILKELLAHLEKERGMKPLLLKFSSDLERSECHKLVDVALSYNINGFVIANTSLKREALLTPSSRLKEIGSGGLSGRPLFKKSNDLLKLTSEITEGRVPLIASGGVFSRDDFQRKLDLGATLVQIYTGLIYRGPLVVKELL